MVLDKARWALGKEATMSETSRLFHLISGGVSVVIDARGSGVPRITHWGSPLVDISAAGLDQLVSASLPQIVSNSIDSFVPLAVLPEQTAGWAGTPGISGHRDGTFFSPGLELVDASVGESPDARFGDRRFLASLADPDAGLVVELVIELSETGVLRSKATLT
ncbi:MAG: alpha-galactosidase, partial [Glaciihabitans sp.]|nr:alpha-galactosidase [Glaciihabitans sp.]